MFIGAVDVENVQLTHVEKEDQRAGFPGGWVASFWETTLEGVVRTGQCEKVRAFLEEGISVHTQFGWEGKTALHIAVELGFLDIVQFLIEKGANVNALTYSGATPLHLAAQNNNADLCAFLLKMGADAATKGMVRGKFVTALDIAQAYNFTSVYTCLLKAGVFDEATMLKSMILAIHSGDAVLANLLLEAGLSPNLCDKEENSFLYLAILKSRNEIARLLIKKGANCDEPSPKTNLTPLILATQRKNPFIVRLLVDKGVNIMKTAKVEYRDVSAFDIAISSDSKELIKAFLKKEGGSVSKQELLLLAVEKECYAICEMLLEEGADPNGKNSQGKLPLYEAVRKNNTYISILLVLKGANPDLESDKNETPLELAARTKSASELMVSVLYDAGKKNEKLLSKALLSKNYDMVTFLLKKGHKLSAIHPNGNSSFFIACQTGDKSLFDLIARHIKVDPHERNSGGRTLLHAAVEGKNAALIIALLEEGCDVNAEDDKGDTPLYIAAKVQEGRSMVRALIKGGADVNKRNNISMTPLMNAAFGGDIGIVKELLLWGAKKELALQIDVEFSFSRGFYYIYTEKKTVRKGGTALDIAKAVDSKEVILLLTE